MKALRYGLPLIAAAAVMIIPAVPAQAQNYQNRQVTTTTTYQWDAVPQGYSDIARRGWHDGLEAARMDWEAHRTMDPYHTMMFRRPPVQGPAKAEYRNAYLRGYDAAMHHNRGWDNNHENWRDNHENWDNEHQWDNDHH